MANNIIDRLTPGEEVLARKGAFYATTHRIIEFVPSPQGDSFSELPYLWLRSVDVISEPDRKVMAKGTVLGIAGILMYALLAFATSLLVVIAGVGLILYGAKGHEAYYQLTSERLSKEEQARWRIPVRGAFGFIVAIGERSGKPLRRDGEPDRSEERF